MLFRIGKGFAAVPAMCLVAGAHGQTLSALKTTVPTVIANSTMTGAPSSSMVLHVSVNLAPPNLSAIQAFADSVSNPTSANYHKFITPTQFGQMFGQSPANFNAVVNYLKSQGFKIDLVGANNLNILAEGTVAQAQTAFHTTIKQFHSNLAGDKGRLNYYSFTSPLQAPTSIASIIQSTSGFENHTMAIPLHKGIRLAKKKQSGPVPLTPVQTSVLYDVAPLHAAGFLGQGRTVGISNFDGYELSNIPLWYSAYGLPAPSGGVGTNVKVETVGTGAGSGFEQGEGDLDIQMVLGQAPLCNLIIYDNGTDDLLSVLAQEVNDNSADLITESYGWNFDSSTAETAHTSRLQMTAQGQTYMKATGDTGTTFSPPFTYGDYDPEILGVGGTVATFTSTGARISEVGWSGSGGGWVTTPSVPFNVLPTWQKATGVPTNLNFRLFPDVAAVAAGSNVNGEDPGAYYFFFQGALNTGDGTSFASPVFTGCLTTMEQDLISINYVTANSAGKYRLGRVNDLFYRQNQRSDVWYDVTSGSNGILPNGTVSQAGSGWDFVTGLGAMDFAVQVKALTANPPVTIGPSATPAIYVYGGKALGANAIGSAATLTAADGIYFQENSVPYTSGAIAATTFSFKLTKPVANVGVAQFTFVDTAPKGTTTFLYLKNVSTGAFDAPFATTAMLGTNVKVTSTINLAKYADANGNITVMSEALYPQRLGGTPFVHKVDQATITETFN